MGEASEAEDLSTSEPMKPVKFSELWWELRNNAGRCTGHRKNGNRCQKSAMEAQRVCGTHGGRAPQSRRKARQRIEEAADRMARELLKMATDENVSDSVKLAAIRDALDRGGLKAPTQVDVEVGVMKPYERLLAGMADETRAESRARRGIPEPTTHVSLPSAYSGREVLDIEPVAESGGPANRPHWAVGDAAWPDDATGQGFGRQSASAQQGQQPGTELMTLEEANAQLAEDARRSWHRRQHG